MWNIGLANLFHFINSHFLDPPRAGLSSKVIMSCRKLERMKRLIYVSCDPNNALKNIVDLCRPESKRYECDPFKIEKIKPVDMFPGTKHLEWVILLTR
jgi:tRNA (uracil-5-)-methyltransferase